MVKILTANSLPNVPWHSLSPRDFGAGREPESGASQILERATSPRPSPPTSLAEKEKITSNRRGNQVAHFARAVTHLARGQRFDLRVDDFNDGGFDGGGRF
jgi:hypothetical protein